MKKEALVLAVIAATGARTAHGIDADTVAGVCQVYVPPTSMQTWSCPNAFTQVENFFEALVVDQVRVSALFAGPDYLVEREDLKTVFAPLSSTWRVEVSHMQCAFSGTHSASGLHTVYFTDGNEQGPVQLNSSFLQLFCDCGIDPP